MAIWQYDFVAIPRSELSNLYGAIPVVMQRDHFSEEKFWRVAQPPGGFEEIFEKWQPEMKSWHDELRLWGTEESNRIDVHYKRKRISSIEFRVELRALSTKFIETICAFARKSDCALVSAHSLVIVKPVRQNILLHLCRSPGANRVLDWLYGVPTSLGQMDRPTVFLSHSSRDKPFVSRLAIDLKSKGVPVWFDQWELKVGDSLSERIEHGISQSGWLAVVISKNSVSSDWVQKELRAAQARELRDKSVFVLPIIIDDCEIPLFLLDKLYADFRSSYDQGLEALLKRVLEGAGA